MTKDLKMTTVKDLMKVHNNAIDNRGKNYTNQFSLQSKGAVTVEDYWTECQCYDIVWVCFVFGNCNHCCFCCGHPFTMLGVSLSLVKIKYSVCVCEKKIKIKNN